MWQFLFQVFGRRAAVVAAFPIALVLGTTGYFLEGWVSDRYTPPNNEAIDDARMKRLVEEELKGDPTKVDSLVERKFVPKNVFEKNVAPSLENFKSR